MDPTNLEFAKEPRSSLHRCEDQTVQYGQLADHETPKYSNVLQLV